MAVPVVETATGKKMVVSEAAPPRILDVNCADGKGTLLSWSRINGDVRLGNQVAFNLDPSSGVVSWLVRNAGDNMFFVCFWLFAGLVSELLPNSATLMASTSSIEVSGTPLLGLSSTQGRAEVNISCDVALGGSALNCGLSSRLSWGCQFLIMILFGPLLSPAYLLLVPHCLSCVSHLTSLVFHFR